MTQLGQCDTENANVSLHDELATFCEIRRKEDGQENLGELTGLEVDGPDADPNASATTGETNAWNKWQQQQHQASSKRRELITAKIACAFNEYQRGGESQ